MRGVDAGQGFKRLKVKRLNRDNTPLPYPRNFFCFYYYKVHPSFPVFAKSAWSSLKVPYCFTWNGSPIGNTKKYIKSSFIVYLLRGGLFRFFGSFGLYF